MNINQIKSFFDEYSLKARVFSGLLAFLPLFLLLYLFFHEIFGLNIYVSIGSSSLLLALVLFLISDITRNLGKYLEKITFNNELDFPTTSFLLHSGKSLTPEKRQSLYAKMTSDFQCVLCTPEEQESDLNLAKQRIKEAVGLVRGRVGDSKLLFQCNIRYGFWRNLIGAAPLSVLFSMIGLAVAFTTNSPGLIIIFFVLGFLYTLIFFLRKPLLTFFGEQYTEQLFLDYLK